MPHLATLALLWTGLLLPLAAASPEVSAQLVLPTSLPTGGQASGLLRLEAPPAWHFYWRNPGDAGLPPRLEWQLPEGVTVTEIRWPTPQRFGDQDIAAFGYDTTLALEIVFAANEQITPGPHAVEATVDWMVCDDARCLPGSNELSDTMTIVTDTEASGDAPGIEAVRAEQPARLPAALEAEVQAERLLVHIPEALRAGWDFLPTAEGWASNRSPMVSVDGSQIAIFRRAGAPVPDEPTGILFTDHGTYLVTIAPIP